MVIFGTSGWRGRLAEEITFRNVSAVSRAIGRFVKKAQKGKKVHAIKVAIGQDTRFLSEQFARTAAAALLEEGITPILLEGFTPTPVISSIVLRRKLSGGINITGSYHPPEWNGIRFTASTGAPVPPDVAGEIERSVVKILASEKLHIMPPENPQVKTLDPSDDYVERIEKIIDLKTIANSKIAVCADPAYGAGLSHISRILKKNRIRFEMIHDRRDVMFGGRAPEPSEENLAELKRIVLGKRMGLGFALSADAGRYGCIDRGGTFISPNLILGLLTEYLVESRGWKSGVGLTVATGHLMKEVARKNGIPVYVTPVGFTYLAGLIANRKAFLVGEESAAMSIQGHIPEKDGILAALLVLEMVARRGKSLKQLGDLLFKKIGKFCTERVDLHAKENIIDRFERRMKIIPDRIAGKKVREIDEMDGTKILLEDDSWLLCRRSCTEPVVRLYAEAHSEADLSNLIAESKKFVIG